MQFRQPSVDGAKGAGYRCRVAHTKDSQDLKETFVSGGPDGTAPTSLSRDVDRLVHKFRTPLNSLSLNADLLGSVSLSKPGKDALYARALKSLQTEVSRLDKIAGDFQRYVGVFQLKPLKISITELLTNAIGEAGDGPKPDVVVPKSIASVDADPRLVVSALAELIKNGREAGGDGSVKIEVTDAPDAVHFNVSDHGAGIELDPAERAFELFFSVKQGHLGFGLTYARRIARAHDGDITIAKTSKEGTTMRLTLPRKS
jgi:signal transduction histidine kinase